MKKILIFSTIIFCFSLPLQADLAMPYSVYQKISCPAEKPIQVGDKCYSCDEPNAIPFLKDCQTICPNRILSDDVIGGNLSKVCVLSKCPSETPLRNANGECYRCDSEAAVATFKGYCTSICPNRIETTKGIVNPKGALCLLPSCPPDKPLKDRLGGCYSCDDTQEIYTDRDSCTSICPNRIEIETRGVCLPSCPENKPLMDEFGECHACDYKHSITMSHDKCLQVCSNRISVLGNQCILPCPADKPLLNLGAGPTGCYSCDYPDDINTKDGACEQVCDNRIYFANSCRIKCPPETPLMDNRGLCYSCDTTETIKSKMCTTTCPNRELLSSEQCALSCPADKPLRDAAGNCRSCYEIDYTISSDSPCEEVCQNRLKIGNKCVLTYCSKDTPLEGGFGGETCYSCDEPTPIELRHQKYCTEICPNRIKVGDKYSKYCALPCPTDKPLMDKFGECHACDEDIFVYTDDMPCSEICPNRQSSNKKCFIPCPADKPIKAYDGTCHSCDETSVFETADCEKCANREQLPIGHVRFVCALKSCPDEQPLRNPILGSCFACDDGGEVYIGLNHKSVCPNRTITEEGYSILSTCPSNKPLKNKKGGCYACDTEGKIFDIDDNTCQTVCPNRQTYYIDNSTFLYCGLKKICPSDKPLLDHFGICHACDDEQVIQSNECNNICSNRTMHNGKCILPCPADKPLLDNEHKCHSCDTYMGVWTNSKTCSFICPNREMVRDSYNRANRCSLINCPPDRPLRDLNSGTCYPCNAKGTFTIDDNISCTEVCPNRSLTDTGRCTYNYCPSYRPLMDNQGNCYSCDTENAVYTEDMPCENICPNRIKNKRKCILKNKENNQ